MDFMEDNIELQDDGAKKLVVEQAALSSTSVQCPFLNLPKELRLCIYDETGDDETIPIIHRLSAAKRKGLKLDLVPFSSTFEYRGLLSCCKQIRNEYTDHHRLRYKDHQIEPQDVKRYVEDAYPIFGVSHDRIEKYKGSITIDTGKVTTGWRLNLFLLANIYKASRGGVQIRFNSTSSVEVKRLEAREIEYAFHGLLGQPRSGKDSEPKSICVEFSEISLQIPDEIAYKTPGRGLLAYFTTRKLPILRIGFYRQNLAMAAAVLQQKGVEADILRGSTYEVARIAMTMWGLCRLELIELQFVVDFEFVARYRDSGGAWKWT